MYTNTNKHAEVAADKRWSWGKYLGNNKVVWWMRNLLFLQLLSKFLSLFRKCFYFFICLFYDVVGSSECTTGKDKGRSITCPEDIDGAEV